MDIQKEREAFEKFYKSNFSEMDLSHAVQLRCVSGRYVLDKARWSWESWQAAKAQAVPDGYVLVPKDQLNQWGHMANHAQEYGCAECYEARGYAHSLSCEINEYFNLGAAEKGGE